MYATGGAQDSARGESPMFQNEEEILMFKQPDSSGYKKVAEGMEIKVLVHGENMLMAEFKLAAGSVMPEHGHPHEQTGYVVSGRVRMIFKGKEPFETGAGGSWSIPGRAPHSAEVIEDAVVIEVFTPVREDFLQKYAE
jgi:quercetin dioxygenase-like cupin family protein